MLLRHPELFLADHQIPAYGRVTGGVGPAVPHLQRPQRFAPSHLRHLQISHGAAGVTNEDMIVIEFAVGREALAQPKLSPEHL
ncbi:MAG: hypothetical protein WDO56_32625 [Gammaproteobacteria bacterium]